MTHLAINNLDTLAGKAGVHAFVVGISNYTHLPGKDEPGRAETFNLRKLSSPATSAYRFYEWLASPTSTLSRPLATCHLLLSPTPAESAAIPEMAPFSGASIVDLEKELRQWRRLCGENRESQSIFYFCGHGVQPHDQDAVLLLEDFGAPGLALERGVVRVSNIFQGMAPHVREGVADMDFREIAREQIYLIDACREPPEQLAGLRTLEGVSVFEEILPGEDTRDAPIFFSTISGDQAFGSTGQISIFTAALLEALKIACEEEEQDELGTPRWPVRARHLHDVLKRVLARRSGGPVQRLGNLQGLVGDPVLHYLSGPPEFEAEVTIAPSDVSGFARLRLLSLSNGRTWSTDTVPRPDHPFKVPVQLGFYEIAAEHPGFEALKLFWLPKADQRGSEKLVRLKQA